MRTKINFFLVAMNLFVLARCFLPELRLYYWITTKEVFTLFATLCLLISLLILEKAIAELNQIDEDSPLDEIFISDK